MRTEVRRAHTRANEAARLSAAAQDEADDLRKTIADLREQIGIVEDARTERDLWVVNLLAEHHIECALAEDPYVAIARHIVDLKDTVAEYRHLADKSIATREAAMRKLEAIWAILAGEPDDDADDVVAPDFRPVEILHLPVLGDSP